MEVLRAATAGETDFDLTTNRQGPDGKYYLGVYNGGGLDGQPTVKQVQGIVDEGARFSSPNISAHLTAKLLKKSLEGFHRSLESVGPQGSSGVMAVAEIFSNDTLSNIHCGGGEAIYYPHNSAEKLITPPFSSHITFDQYTDKVWNDENINGVTGPRWGDMTAFNAVGFKAYNFVTGRVAMREYKPTQAGTLLLTSAGQWGQDPGNRVGVEAIVRDNPEDAERLAHNLVSFFKGLAGERTAVAVAHIGDPERPTTQA